MRIPSSSIIGAATLGLASVISASGADEKKTDTTPNKPKAMELKPLDKKNLNEEQSPLSEKIANGFFALSAKTGIPLMRMISEETQIKMAKRFFAETKEALDKNSLDLDDKEKQSTSFIMNLPESQLKTILKESKKEYQDLIEAYIDFIANPKKNRELHKNIDSFRSTLHWWHKDVLPPGLFKEAWYPKIEKIIQRIEKEDAELLRRNEKLKIKDAAQEELVKIVCELAVVELKKDSGIKTPKLYNNLLKLLDQDSSVNGLLYYHLIDISLKGEAYANDIPKGSRVVRDQIWNRVNHIKLDESLIEPVEEKFKKIISNPSNASEKTKGHYDGAMYWARELYRPPYNRSNLLETWHKTNLEKITKEKIENIPEQLHAYVGRCKKLWEPYDNYNLHREFYSVGKPYLKSIIQTGCKAILNPNQNESIKGAKILSAVTSSYYDSRYMPNFNLIPIQFSKDDEMNDLFISVVKHYQDSVSELPTNERLDTGINFLTLSHDRKVVENVSQYLNRQISLTVQKREKVLNPKELKITEEQNLQLLKTINQFMEQMPNFHSPYKEFIPWIEGATPLYKQAGEIITKGPTNKESLSVGRNLFLKLKYLPKGNESRTFIEEQVINNLFTSLMESSNRLSDEDKAGFRNLVYGEIPEACRSGDGLRYKFIIEPLLKIVSEKCFDSSYDEGLNEFVNFINAVQQDQYYSIRRNLILRMTDLKKDYLRTAVQHSVKKLKSEDIELQKKSLNELSNYYRILRILPNVFEEPNNSYLDDRYISKEQISQIKDLIKSNVSDIGQTFVNNLATIKVSTEISSKTKKHVVRDEAFEANIDALKEIFNDFPSEQTKLLQTQLSKTICNRLQTENDIKSRMMLYKAVGVLPVDAAPLLSQLKKEIVFTDSPKDMPKLGEALAYLFMRELLENKNINQIVYQDTSDLRKGVIEVRDRIKTFNDKLELRAKTGEIKLDEKTPVQNLILNLVGYSSGSNLELFLRENLNDELIDKLNSSVKSNGKIDPDILKTCFRVLGNSNGLLSGFGKAMFRGQSEQLFFIHNQDPLLNSIFQECQNTGEAITMRLERNMRLTTPVKTMPYVSAGLVELYRYGDSFDSELKINELGERLFKGSDKTLSMFEIYERSLQSRFLWQHLESVRNDKRIDKSDLKEIETNCYELLRNLDKLDSIKDVNLRKSKRVDLGLDIRKLNLAKYRETVTEPVYNTKINFVKEFIKLAPEGQRRNYMDIVLNRFGFRNQFTEQDWLKILDDE